MKPRTPAPKHGGTRPRRVTQADKANMQRIYQETGNWAEVARRTGFAYITVWKHMKGYDTAIPSESFIKPVGVDEKGKKITEVDIPPPKSWDALTEQEKGWLTNFAEFRRHFFRRETPPFQQEIANEISSKEHQKILVLTPPGHGKTQCFSVDYPIWEMLRNRAMGTKDGWACMLISKSDKMAQAFLSQIKRELEQNTQLAYHFGRFKPEYPDVWKKDMLTVEGFPIRKEPTFITAGAGSHIYGWRVHLIIADDVVDGENSKTPESAEKLAQWWADELESRLEPNGVIADVGTRFAVFDLHGKIWRQRDDDEQPIWHPIIYRAHDSSVCRGEHCETCRGACTHEKPFPEGCILWPGRFGWKALRARRSGQVSSARFEFIYNQMEIPDEDGLAQQSWIDACKDSTRSVWDFPRDCRVMCTLDPSPTQWAVAECWAYVPSEDKRYLVAVHRQRRMQAPAYLALMKDWTLKCRAAGHDPIWIVEINAAQRWMLQSTEYMQLRYEIGLSVQPHTTHRNKTDPMYGVQQLGPTYEYGKINLPWGDPTSRKQVQPLIEELITYPAGETDDAVMAQWFMEYNVRKLNMPISGQFVDYPEMPPWLLERREMVDPNTGLRTAVN